MRQLAIAAVVLAFGCAPKGGHTTDSSGPYNLLVHNYYDSHDVVLYISPGDPSTPLDSAPEIAKLGKVDPHTTGYYWIQPGVHRVEVTEGDLTDTVVLPASDIEFKTEGFVQLDFRP